jgi:multidrug efflux pump subunit AcrA (membrane-fusion protein)
MKESFMKGYGKYILFVVVIVITLLWLSGFFTPKIKSGEIKPQAKKVSGLKVAEVEVVEALQTPYFGLVQPDDRAEIASRVFGRVERVFVKEGDAVSTREAPCDNRC